MKWCILLSCASLLVLAQRVAADEPTRCVQEELRRRNLYFGEIDGRSNNELRGALRRYQERKSLQVTGEIDEDTARSLNVTGPIAPPRVAREQWPDVAVLRSDEARAHIDTETAAAPSVSEAAAADAPPAPADSPVGLQEINPEQITKLVESYLRDAETDDTNLQVSYYMFPVRYFDHGEVDRDFVVRDTSNYVKRWPTRSYHLTGPVTCLANAKGDEIEVQFPISFSVKNAKHDVRGRTANFWTLKAENGGELKIVAIREQRMRD